MSFVRKKILVTFGTRPEAIKMAPLILKFNEYSEYFDVKVCITAQHRDLLDQVLNFFSIHPDYDLNIMRPNQRVDDIVVEIVTGMPNIINDFKPDYIFVHGDTTTSFSVALSAFLHKIEVAHVEAGLRTYKRYLPFPEEMNRILTAKLSNYHFAPTNRARMNLLKEGVGDENILVTGNTVIDALFLGLDIIKNNRPKTINEFENKYPLINNLEMKQILVTGHRRENIELGLPQVCDAILDIVNFYDSVLVVFPVHPNPHVRKVVFSKLNHQPRVILSEPVDYPTFIWLMQKSTLIITDSGGVQEEAPTLQKPVLVTRNETERPEALKTGLVQLVGMNRFQVVSSVKKILDFEFENKGRVITLKKEKNPFGDGSACQRIIDFLMSQQNLYKKTVNN